MNSPKYNRTPHLPWSKGATKDDRIATDLSLIIDNEIVITEKIDGSNTSLESENCFARTHSGPPSHISFDGLKALHATIKFKIPNNLQLFGEWVFAKHSILYDKLPGYFLLFNVREINDKSHWLSWDEVEMWAQEIEVPTVPILFKGKVNSEAELKKLTNSFMDKPSECGGLREGIVVRVNEAFNDDGFDKCVLKMVRENHVTTSNHWKDEVIIKNKLKIL